MYSRNLFLTVVLSLFLLITLTLFGKKYKDPVDILKEKFVIIKLL